MAFLYVSDDMDWGRKNLKNDNDDLFFVGSGEAAGATEKETVEAVSFDLVNTAFRLKPLNSSSLIVLDFKI